MRRRLRGIWTRILHGGLCGVPCVDCGRPTTYWSRYCEAHLAEFFERPLPAQRTAVDEKVSS